MKELQTLALGLVVVFLDVSTPDWIADPLGWVLVLVALAAMKDRLPDYRQVSLAAWVSFGLSVLTWPSGSVVHLDGWLGLLFSLPTLAFCYLLSDSLRDVTEPGRAGWFRAFCWAYALLVLLPGAIYGLDQDWLGTPTAVLAVAVNIGFVVALFSASDEDAYRPLAGDAGDSGDARDTGDDGDDGDSDRADDPGKHRA